MKKSLLFLTLFIFINAVFGQKNSIRASDLIGCWKYYPEEGKNYPNISVFRPCSSKSILERLMRYRFKIELIRDEKTY